MKKLIICLLTVLSLLLCTNVYAEENVVDIQVEITTDYNGYYEVTIPASVNNLLASKKPTMKVNAYRIDNNGDLVYAFTDANDFTVFDPSNNVVKSELESDSVVSFEVTKAGTYKIRPAANGDIVDYDSNGRLYIDGIISSSQNFKINGTVVNPSTTCNSIAFVISAVDCDDQSLLTISEEIPNKENLIDIFFFDITCTFNGTTLNDFGSDNDELLPMSVVFGPLDFDPSTQEIRIYRLHNGVVKQLKAISYEPYYADGYWLVKFNSSHFSTYAFAVANKTASSSRYVAPKTCVD